MIFIRAKNKHINYPVAHSLPKYIYFIEKNDDELPYKYAIDEENNYYLDILDEYSSMIKFLDEQLKDYFDIFEIEIQD